MLVLRLTWTGARWLHLSPGGWNNTHWFEQQCRIPPGREWLSSMAMGILCLTVDNSPVTDHLKCSPAAGRRRFRWNSGGGSTVGMGLWVMGSRSTLTLLNAPLVRRRRFLPVGARVGVQVDGACCVCCGIIKISPPPQLLPLRVACVAERLRCLIPAGESPSLLHWLRELMWWGLLWGWQYAGVPNILGRDAHCAPERRDVSLFYRHKKPHFHGGCNTNGRNGVSRNKGGAGEPWVRLCLH